MEKPSGLRAVFTLRREELPFALLMFGYFFLVITSFWILKPVKKTLFIGFYDQSGLSLLGAHLDAAQAELIAKVLNMVVAFLAVVVFSALSERLRRQRLTLVFSGFFLLSYAGYALLLDSPGHLTVWSFYLFGDLFSTLMVATFFAFLNDSGLKRVEFLPFNPSSAAKYEWIGRPFENAGERQDAARFAEIALRAREAGLAVF